MYYCVICSEDIPKGRALLGYKTCLCCGERKAKEQRHCIVPLHKSNYIPVFNLGDLVGINSKGGQVK